MASVAVGKIQTEAAILYGFLANPLDFAHKTIKIAMLRQINGPYNPVVFLQE